MKGMHPHCYYMGKYLEGFFGILREDTFVNPKSARSIMPVILR